MRRSEVVGDDWIIPPQRYKTNLELVIPLSAAGRAVLARVPQIGNSDFVFTTDGKTPISGFSKFKRAFDQACGVTGWTLARSAAHRAIIDEPGRGPQRPCGAGVGACDWRDSLNL